MICTSTNDDKEFGEHFLADIMAWIADRFEPSDLYAEEQLKEYIRDTFDPDDVFTDDQLASWAKQNLF